MMRFNLILFIGLITVGCSGGTMKTTAISLPSLKEVPESAWQKLAEKKIYFGHQSVGFNIVDGIKDVQRENPNIRLVVQETDDPNNLNSGIFAHSKIGQNRNPEAKMKGFSNLLEKGIGNKADMAFLKFCYVDITSSTDVEKLFTDYKKTLHELQAKYPQTIFLHMTAPLTSEKEGFMAQTKGMIKKFIGKPDPREDNLQREKFNNLLRTTYGLPAHPETATGGADIRPQSLKVGPQFLLFDLAFMESTLPEGVIKVSEKGGKKYYSLIPDYTKDGGHLNEKGRKFIAEQFLIFLAKNAAL